MARIPSSRNVAIAVCFLHSYANPAHELAAKAVVETARPGQFVCASAEVLPQFREYERFNTTALNAYIGPLMDGYLTRLEQGLGEHGYRRDLHIMTSAGGVATAARARRLPISTVLSGPAGGVAAAVHLGADLDIPNIITCDMGGTSTDVCLIEDLKVPVTASRSIAHYANRTPQIEINAVGAGGGSIAWLDAGDMLMVGPQSAGAVPGPACYGRGGTEPTVTDANLVLNRLSAGGALAAGQIPLDRELALAALATLGQSIGLDPVRLADGIVRIAVVRMVSAIKQISIANGHDPRDFVLLPYGGAGPMHAAAIADELEINRILVPVGPGNFAAFGSPHLGHPPGLRAHANHAARRGCLGAGRGHVRPDGSASTQGSGRGRHRGGEYRAAAHARHALSRAVVGAAGCPAAGCCLDRGRHPGLRRGS